MSQESSTEIVQKFYQYFNETKTDELFDLFSENCIHELNYHTEYGKEKIIEYIEYSYAHYDEKIHDLVIMSSSEGKYVTAKFITKGIYQTTDSSLIPARDQPYTLEVVNYFEIEDGKIIKGSCYFDEKSLEMQLRGESTSEEL